MLRCRATRLAAVVRLLLRVLEQLVLEAPPVHRGDSRAKTTAFSPGFFVPRKCEADANRASAVRRRNIPRTPRRPAAVRAAAHPADARPTPGPVALPERANGSGGAVAVGLVRTAYDQL